MQLLDQQQVYSKLARVYDLVGLHLLRNQDVAENYVRAIPLDPAAPIRVLDAGCGTGFYSMAVLKRFPLSTIVAFDLSRKMLSLFQKKVEKGGLSHRVRIFQHNVLDPVPEETPFDLVITGGLLEHVDAVAAIRNLVRNLRPGGWFFNGAVRRNLVGSVLGHMYAFDPYPDSSNRRFLEEAGLVDVRAFVIRRGVFPYLTENVRLGILGRKPS